MKLWTRGGELKRMLRRATAPAPPPDLAQRIKSEIPPLLARPGLAPRRAGLVLNWPLSRYSFAASIAVHAAVVALAVAAGWWSRAHWTRPTAGRAWARAEVAAWTPVWGVHPMGFVSAAEVHRSSFGLDVAPTSYETTRAYLKAGLLPPPAAVQTEEFINALDYGDPAPRGQDVALRGEGGPSPFAEDPGRRLVRFNLRTRNVDPPDRRPTTLAFVIDVSRAMGGERRLGLVKTALFDLARRLRPTDQVALVSFSSQARVVLPPTNDPAALTAALYAMAPDGSSSATSSGLDLGLRLAERCFRIGTCNKVILCSGGAAEHDLSWPRPGLARIAEQSRGGVEVATIGFRADPGVEEMLERLASATNSTYSAADTGAEARQILAEALTGAPQSIGADASVDVDFNPQVVSRYRLLGYERQPTPEALFQSAGGGGAELLGGASITSLYEIELQVHPTEDRVATLGLRYRPAGRLTVVRETRELRISEVASTWDAASPSLRLAASMAEFAETLRDNPEGRGDAFGATFRRAQGLLRDYPERKDVADFVALAGAAAQARPYSPEAAAAAGRPGPEAVSVSVGEGSEPVLLRKFEPAYPDAARRAQVAGTVLLRAQVSPHGDVDGVTVLKSIPLLDPAAISAVRRWKYQPALLEGRPVVGYVTIAVRFQLED